MFPELRYSVNSLASTKKAVLSWLVSSLFSHVMIQTVGTVISFETSYS